MVRLPCEGCHPRICPASVSNTKKALRVVDQKTRPVGLIGTCTIRGTGVPSARYNVETFVPLSDTHQGDVGAAARPQALTRFGSTNIAMPGTFETRGCTV